MQTYGRDLLLGTDKLRELIEDQLVKRIRQSLDDVQRKVCATGVTVKDGEGRECGVAWGAGGPATPTHPGLPQHAR